jgi:hypothetical protein
VVTRQFWTDAAPSGTRLGFAVPHDWDVYDAPPVLALLRPRRRDGWFHTNLLVARTLVHPGVTIRDIAGRARAHRHATHGEIELLGERADAGGHVLAQIVGFDTERPAARVAQLHALVLPPGRAESAQEVYELIGTCLLDDLDRHEAAFGEILATAEVVSDRTAA